MPDGPGHQSGWKKGFSPPTGFSSNDTSRNDATLLGTRLGFCAWQMGVSTKSNHKMPEKLGATGRIQWCISPIVFCQTQWNTISAGNPTWEWKITNHHCMIYCTRVVSLGFAKGRATTLPFPRIAFDCFIHGHWPMISHLRTWRLHTNASHPLDMFFPSPMILRRWQVYHRNNDQTSQVNTTTQTTQKKKDYLDDHINAWISK